MPPEYMGRPLSPIFLSAMIMVMLLWHTLMLMHGFSYVDVTRQEGLEMQLRAREKLSAIGQITSGVAHNYKNMLAVALPNLEAIPRYGNEEQWEDYVAPATEAIEPLPTRNWAKKRE